jgi:cell division protein ZapE
MPHHFLDELRRVARAHGFSPDLAQERIAASFERLSADLDAIESKERPLLRLLRRPPRIPGIYLWGAVGRGKSFLMDEFYRLAPLARKQRIHFHRFMQDIHHRLRDLQGQPEPLSIIARQVARDTRLLCLDEFHITDIGDAMLMRGLLDGLFESNVVLVTTSNQHPDALYEHGLQRAQFRPAIDLIKQNMEVLQLDGGSDYRLRTLERAGVFHFPLDERARAALEKAFIGIAGEPGTPDAALEIEGRLIQAQRLAPGVAWFEFAQLCDGPRGTADYIELARRYHTVVIWGVPVLLATMAERVRRFTWLVDEFYDRRVKLILAAEAPLPGLFDRLASRPDIDRTLSRLVEMQTAQYLTQPHLA